MEKDKMVSHPDHYISKNGLETIDVIEAFTAELNGMEAVDTAQVIKYICRWKKKNGLQDLKKAHWYLEHLIDLVEAKEICDHPFISKSQYGLGAKPLNDFDDILFKNTDEATEFLDKLDKIIDENEGTINVQQVYILAGIKSVFEYAKWDDTIYRHYGWITTEKFTVKSVDAGGVALVLPDAYPIVD